MLNVNTVMDELNVKLGGYCANCLHNPCDCKFKLDLHNVINWVSIKDELPPNKTKRYLTYKDNEMVFQNWYYVDGSGYWYDYLGVTHWCEIPKPPCL